jgi:hypothetical protein
MHPGHRAIDGLKCTAERIAGGGAAGLLQCLTDLEAAHFRNDTGGEAAKKPSCACMLQGGHISADAKSLAQLVGSQHSARHAHLHCLKRAQEAVLIRKVAASRGKALGPVEHAVSHNTSAAAESIFSHQTSSRTFGLPQVASHWPVVHNASLANSWNGRQLACEALLWHHSAPLNLPQRSQSAASQAGQQAASWVPMFGSRFDLLAPLLCLSPAASLSFCGSMVSQLDSCTTCEPGRQLHGWPRLAPVEPRRSPFSQHRGTPLPWLPFNSSIIPRPGYRLDPRLRMALASRIAAYKQGCCSADGTPLKMLDALENKVAASVPNGGATATAGCCASDELCVLKVFAQHRKDDGVCNVARRGHDSASRARGSGRERDSGHASGPWMQNLQQNCSRAFEGIGLTTGCNASHRMPVEGSQLIERPSDSFLQFPKRGLHDRAACPPVAHAQADLCVTGMRNPNLRPMAHWNATLLSYALGQPVMSLSQKFFSTHQKGLQPALQPPVLKTVKAISQTRAATVVTYDTVQLREVWGLSSSHLGANESSTALQSLEEFRTLQIGVLTRPARSRRLIAQRTVPGLTPRGEAQNRLPRPHKPATGLARLQTGQPAAGKALQAVVVARIDARKDVPSFVSAQHAWLLSLNVSMHLLQQSLHVPASSWRSKAAALKEERTPLGMHVTINTTRSSLAASSGSRLLGGPKHSAPSLAVGTHSQHLPPHNELQTKTTSVERPFTAPASWRAPLLAMALSTYMTALKLASGNSDGALPCPSRKLRTVASIDAVALLRRKHKSAVKKGPACWRAAWHAGSSGRVVHWDMGTSKEANGLTSKPSMGTELWQLTHGASALWAERCHVRHATYAGEHCGGGMLQSTGAFPQGLHTFPTWWKALQQPSKACNCTWATAASRPSSALAPLQGVNATGLRASAMHNIAEHTCTSHRHVSAVREVCQEKSRQAYHSCRVADGSGEAGRLRVSAAKAGTPPPPSGPSDVDLSSGGHALHAKPLDLELAPDGVATRQNQVCPADICGTTATADPPPLLPESTNDGAEVSLEAPATLWDIDQLAEGGNWGDVEEVWDLQGGAPVVMTLCMGAKCNTTAEFLGSWAHKPTVFGGIVLAKRHSDFGNSRKRSRIVCLPAWCQPRFPRVSSNLSSDEKAMLETPLLMLAANGTANLHVAVCKGSLLLAHQVSQQPGSLLARLSRFPSWAGLLTPAKVSSIHPEAKLSTEAPTSQVVSAYLGRAVTRMLPGSVAVLNPSPEGPRQLFQSFPLIAINASSASEAVGSLSAARTLLQPIQAGVLRKTEEQVAVSNSSAKIEPAFLKGSTASGPFGASIGDVELQGTGRSSCCNSAPASVAWSGSLTLRAPERLDVSVVGSSARLQVELPRELVEVLLRWPSRTIGSPRDRHVWQPAEVKAASFDAAVVRWLHIRGTSAANQSGACLA